MGAAQQCTSCCCAKDGADEKPAMTKVRAHSAWAEDLEPTPVQGPVPQELAPSAHASPWPAEAVAGRDGGRSVLAEGHAPAAEEAARAAAAAAAAAGGSAAREGAEESSAFRLQIERAAGETIGINLDVTDGVSLVVVDILPGSIQAWNKAHEHSAHLEINDRIVEANGASGDADKMLSALKQNVVWELVVQRPVLLRAVVSRQGALSLGVDLRYAPNGNTLLISEVEDGPMKDWNACSTTGKVKKFDRIIEVNGVRGTSQHLLQAGMDKEELDMRILHYG